mgnify:FL=1
MILRRKHRIQLEDRRKDLVGMQSTLTHNGLISDCIYIHLGLILGKLFKSTSSPVPSPEELCTAAIYSIMSSSYNEDTVQRTNNKFIPELIIYKPKNGDEREQPYVTSHYCVYLLEIPKN